MEVRCQMGNINKGSRDKSRQFVTLEIACKLFNCVLLQGIEIGFDFPSRDCNAWIDGYEISLQGFWRSTLAYKISRISVTSLGDINIQYKIWICSKNSYFLNIKLVSVGYWFIAYYVFRGTWCKIIVAYIIFRWIGKYLVRCLVFYGIPTLGSYSMPNIVL